MVWWVVQYHCVFDAVYTPRWTRLLRDAEAAGCLVVDGVEMFVGQAAAQFTLFTGTPAPMAIMEEVVMEGRK
jgi:3-dehydroquinate dehydratase / shikimate dehydrogenase